MKKLFALAFLGAVMLLAGCTGTQPGGGQDGAGGSQTGTGSGFLSSLGLVINSEYGLDQSAIISEDLKITVDTVRITRYYSYYSTNWAKTVGKLAASGKKFIIFDLEIKNVGESSITVKEEMFSLVSSDSNYYDPGNYGEDEEIAFTTLSPGLSNRGKMIFEVPASVSESALLFDLDDLFSVSEYIAFNYDSSASVIPETLSGTVDITSVDYTSSSIKYIYYTVENGGNVGFVPVIDYTVYHGSDLVRSSTKENPFDTIVLPEDSTSEQIAAHIPISEAGTYTINFELSDKVSSEVIDTTTQEIVIS